MVQMLRTVLLQYYESMTEDEKEWVENQKNGCIQNYVEISGFSGHYFEHPNRVHGKSHEKEILQTAILAHFGFDVYLIEEPSVGGKKVDALVDGVPVDFKKVGSGNSAI